MSPFVFNSARTVKGTKSKKIEVGNRRCWSKGGFLPKTLTCSRWTPMADCSRSKSTTRFLPLMSLFGRRGRGHGALMRQGASVSRKENPRVDRSLGQEGRGGGWRAPQKATRSGAAVGVTDRDT